MAVAVITKDGAAEFSNLDRKSTRLNSSHDQMSYAVFCLKKKNQTHPLSQDPPTRAAKIIPQSRVARRATAYPAGQPVRVPARYTFDRHASSRVSDSQPNP